MIEVYKPCHTSGRNIKNEKRSDKESMRNKLPNCISNSGRLPTDAEMVVTLKSSVERRRWVARRTASAMITPTMGAMKSVKNPMIDARKLPPKESAAAIIIARI